MINEGQDIPEKYKFVGNRKKGKARINIRNYQTGLFAYLAEIDKNIIKLLDEYIDTYNNQNPNEKLNRTDWINKCCNDSFGFTINTKEDLTTLRSLMIPNLYEDIGDWIRDNIRKGTNLILDKGGRSDDKSKERTDS